jgi:TatD DNase family protein
MQFIDTHTHLYLPEFDADRDEMIRRSVSSGVIRLLMPNIDIHSAGPLISAAERYEDHCFPMIGLHPTSVKEDYREQLDELEKIARSCRFIAVGEIGIDLYHDKSRVREQTDAFSRQVAFASRSGLPAVIHSRNAFSQVLSVLEECSGNPVKGVFHAFSGNADDAAKAIDMGFMIGIGGALTFKNSSTAGIVKYIGINNIVLETDSPYLAPEPYRGKRNESSYIPLINRKLAAILGISENECAAITFENSLRLFNIS